MRGPEAAAGSSFSFLYVSKITQIFFYIFKIKNWSQNATCITVTFTVHMHSCMQTHTGSPSITYCIWEAGMAQARSATFLSIASLLNVSVCSGAFTWLYQIKCVWLSLWFFHSSVFASSIMPATICGAKFLSLPASASLSLSCLSACWSMRVSVSCSRCLLEYALAHSWRVLLLPWFVIWSERIWKIWLCFVQRERGNS